MIGVKQNPLKLKTKRIMLKRHRPLSFKHLLVQDSDTESDDTSNYQMTQPRFRFQNSKTIAIANAKNKGKQRLNFGDDLQLSKPIMGPNFDPGLNDFFSFFYFSVYLTSWNF